MTPPTPQPGPDGKLHPRDPDFVILAAQRTGSTMLVSRLQSHPDLACMGEIFVRNAGPEVGALKGLPERVVEEFSPVEVRTGEWRRFLREVARAQDTPWGFKLMANQSRAVRRYLIGRTLAKPIVLRRENVLAVFASGRMAQARRHGAHVATVPFEAARFHRFRARYERGFAQVQADLDRAGRAYLGTTYETLTGPEGAAENARILAFLGADILPLRSRTPKRNSDDIAGRFDDAGAVRACLDEIGRPEWALDRTETV